MKQGIRSTLLFRTNPSD